MLACGAHLPFHFVLPLRVGRSGILADPSPIYCAKARAGPPLNHAQILTQIWVISFAGSDMELSAPTYFRVETAQGHH